MDVHLLDFNGGVTNRGTPALQTLLGGARHWRVREHGELPPGPSGAWVLTGGPGSPLEAGPWRAPLYAALRERVYAGLPTLAICYGFEVLAHALGAAVRPLTDTRTGVLPLRLTERGRADPLFGGLDGAAIFENRQWGVFGAVGGGVVLAEGAEGDVAAMRFGAAVLGVIFHPEADPAGVKAAFADRVATGGDALPPEALERMYTSMVPGFLREARG